MYINAYIKGIDGNAFNTKPKSFKVVDSIPQAVLELTWDYQQEGLAYEVTCRLVDLDCSNSWDAIKKYFFVEVIDKVEDEVSATYYAIPNYYEALEESFGTMREYNDFDEWFDHAITNGNDTVAAVEFAYIPGVEEWLADNLADIDDYYVDDYGHKCIRDGLMEVWQQLHGEDE